jgi:hypothetical protein
MLLTYQAPFEVIRGFLEIGVREKANNAIGREEGVFPIESFRFGKRIKRGSKNKDECRHEGVRSKRHIASASELKTAQHKPVQNAQ